jgi:hypothetical protein
MNDEGATGLKTSNGVLGTGSKHVPAEELVKHIECMRNLIETTKWRSQSWRLSSARIQHIATGKRALPRRKHMRNMVTMHIYASTRPICVGLRLVFQIANDNNNAHVSSGIYCSLFCVHSSFQVWNRCCRSTSKLFEIPTVTQCLATAFLELAQVIAKSKRCPQRSSHLTGRATKVEEWVW